MSTRSNIAVQNKDGSVSAIYCHSDGYPSHNGHILLEHYDTEEKVRELIALGDISSLGSKVKPDEGETHSYSDRADGVTVAYHRDRGEPHNPAAELPSREDLVKERKNWGAEYQYLFTPEGWVFSDHGAAWKPLTEQDCKE